MEKGGKSTISDNAAKAMALANSEDEHQYYIEGS